MRCTGCFSDSSRLGRVAEETDRRGEKEFEEGDKAYATVVGSIEQFEDDYDEKHKYDG